MDRLLGTSLPESAGSVLPADIIVLGKIVGPYGLRGAVKVHPFADDPMVWAKLPRWWVGQEGIAPERWRQTRLLGCKAHGDVLIAELECLADRNAAEAVHGALVGAPRAALPPAAKNEYYWADLIGLEVKNTRDQSLGRVLGLIETPANAVLRVGSGEQAEQLLPFVAAVVLDVDLAAGTVRVDWEAHW
ncbi:ribosome maturation factor RimM [Propionivibrio sp.]|uniref:ribosome maturation factor RimM n=1 Tax=Propionivibrio sp. TaxID=2212460 RepID=UPI00342D00B8